MFRGFLTAVRTLTILPVPGKDAPGPASALPWFPVVGFLLGGVLHAMALGCIWLSKNPWPEGAALLVLAGGTVLTGGLHLDGLADWADGFGGWGNKKKILAIMRDPHIGVFGGIALCLDLLAKWVALVQLAATGQTLWIVAAYTVSRTMQVCTAVTLPYARTEGGTGAAFVQEAKPSHRLCALVVSGVLLGAFLGPAGLASLGLGIIAASCFSRWCLHRVGGITGDLLGAQSEIVEIMILVLCAFLGPGLTEFSGWAP